MFVHILQRLGLSFEDKCLIINKWKRKLSKILIEFSLVILMRENWALAGFIVVEFP